jgi:excisionase family DNA binding protein
MQFHYYSPDEIAAALRVSGEVIRKQCRGGSIKSTKVGSKYRISAREVRRHFPDLFREGGPFGDGPAAAAPEVAAASA